MKNPENQIAKKSKSSFYYAFNILGKEKSQDMNTLYAFCRVTDDIVDDDGEPEEKKVKLKQWEEKLKTALLGHKTDEDLLNNFAIVVKKYQMDENLPFELIRGMYMDLEQNEYNTFNDLEDYCFCVASVVGLMSIEIFGYKNPKIKNYAVNLGKALQLTNIMRDVKKDAAIDRIYIPKEFLNEYSVSTEDIINKKYSINFFSLMTRMKEKALFYFTEAERNLVPEDTKSMFPAIAMGKIYYKILKKLIRYKYDIFSNDLNISRQEKIFTTLITLLKYKLFY